MQYVSEEDRLDARREVDLTLIKREKGIARWNKVVKTMTYMLMFHTLVKYLLLL